MRNSVLWLALGSMAAYDFPVIAAATDEPLPAAVQERLEALERKVRTLGRQLEVEQETKAADKAKQTATISAGAEGFTLKSTDGAFQLKLRGLLHADSRWFFEGESPGNDDTLLRRSHHRRRRGHGLGRGLQLVPQSERQAGLGL